MSKGLLWKEWRQNAWILILILVACIGSEMITATDAVDGFNDNYNYYHSEEFQKENNSMPKDERMTGSEIEDSLTLIPYDFEGSWPLLIFVFLFLGLKLTVFEKNKQLEYFTYGLPYSKKQIFWHKMIFPALLIIVVIPIIILLRDIYIYQQIPGKYLPDFSMMWLFIGAVVLLVLFSYTLSMAVGNLVGDIIIAGVIALGSLTSFLYMLPSALTNLIDAFEAFFSGKTINQLPNIGEFWFSQFPAFFGESFNLGEYIVLAILIIAMVIISWFGFKTASLENNGRFLMNNKFRMPILIVGTIYLTICLSGRFQYFDYEKMITSGEIITLLVKMILIALVSIIAFWLLMYKWKTLRKS